MHLELNSRGQSFFFLQHKHQSALVLSFSYSTRATIQLASNFVDVLQWQTQRFVCWASWWQDGIQGFQEGLAGGISFLPFHTPPLVPGHLVRWLQHVISMPSRDWHKSNSLWIVTNLLDVGRNFILDFRESGLKSFISQCILGLLKFEQDKIYKQTVGKYKERNKIHKCNSTFQEHFFIQMVKL